MTTQVCDEKKELFAKILKIKDEIKALATAQRADKAVLRGVHGLLPLQGYTLRNGYKVSRSGHDRASFLQSECCSRASDISGLHIVYNQLRGKPWDMHVSKR